MRYIALQFTTKRVRMVTYKKLGDSMRSVSVKKIKTSYKPEKVGLVPVSHKRNLMQYLL